MAITPEREAEIWAELDAEFGTGPRQARPKVVVAEGRSVRDADVVVSRADPNWPQAEAGVVAVRRSAERWVTINQAEAERQWAEREAAREAEAVRYDPLGLWGPPDVA